MAKDFVTAKIRRQDGARTPGYFQTFRIKKSPFMNIIFILMEIQKNPVDINGNKVNPVVWECSCLEEVCGACTMLINGVPGQACSALVKDLGDKIVLEPLTKFPVVRDLAVNRDFMFDNLKKVKAWINVDETFKLGQGPKFSENLRQFCYKLSRCMTCGCCLEACPQVNKRNSFMGASTLSQVYLMNSHPNGAFNKAERINAILADDGIGNCAKAHNCERVCPKEIPLTEVLGKLNREAVKQYFTNILDK
ncbi:MAG TPA: succinate dehydrogenase iron-sulfur subunit [Spirochaetes bacterium]|nr:succinate dehydrogenase iron-sulfur subunit [Spirochaetota bacterium]